MGWFGGWFSSSSSDPYSKLDPKLRELLEKESPVKYSTQQHTPPSPVPPQPSQPDAVAPSVAESDAPKVPAQSLYQDGRYAHLWKTYRDQGSIEAETKTASEKVEDMLEAYKERNYHIGRAALENCALEQEEWVRCLREGDWSDRLQMCRHQVRKFERCYTMQARFLKVLGYGSTFDSTPRIQEDIQSRADQLFHRMLAQEKAIKEAKEAGLPPPVFPPASVALPLSSPAAPSPQAETDDLAPSEEVLQTWRKKLAGLPEEERAIEEQALRADWRAQKKVATDLRTFWDREAEERKSRQDKGTATLLDTITSALGFTGPGRGPEPKDGKS